MADTASVDDQEKENNSADARKQYKRWSKEISAAKKRTKKWHKQAGKVVKRFLDEGDDQTLRRLNLFHNHVTTLTAMLYGKMPKVDVSRRFADADDDQSRVAAMILQRILNTDIEMSGQNFSSTLRSCLEDRLLPGLGTARVRYEMETMKQGHAPVYDTAGNVVEEGYEEEVMMYEDAPIDYIHWRDFLWGYCRNWSECPWVAFKSYMTKTEITERFGEDAARDAQYKTRTPGTDGEDVFDRDFSDPNEKAEIWEIWCKESASVYWWTDGVDYILDQQEDPLELANFFPCPAPMLANCTTTLMVPKPDFVIAQDLYNEIDELHTRIHMITKAVKVVGVYDKSSEGVKSMMTEGNENDLVPVDNWAMFAEKGGLKGVVDWFPIQEVAEVLDRLRGVRDETIGLLYNVTGMSEVLRGASAGGQPTSATENALKARFASVRVQYLQDEFARFASDLQSLKAEVIGGQFEPQTIVQRSNIDKTPDVQHIQSAIELIKSKNTQWKIDIRPESIAMIDYAQLRSERTEYLTALSTFLQSGQAVVKAIPGSEPMLMQLMKWGLAGFKGSQEIEGVIDQAITQAQKAAEAAKNQPPPPSPEQIKAQTEMAKLKMKHDQDMQKETQKAVRDMQKLNAQLFAELQKIQAQTQATISEEAAQAHFNILEKKAEPQPAKKD